MKQEDLERQLVFSRTPESKREERERIARDVEQYLASGKEIEYVGVSYEHREQYK